MIRHERIVTHFFFTFVKETSGVNLYSFKLLVLSSSTVLTSSQVACSNNFHVLKLVIRIQNGASSTDASWDATEIEIELPRNVNNSQFYRPVVPHVLRKELNLWRSEISWKLRENKNSSSAKYKTNRSRANVLRYLPVFALSFQSLLCTISRRAFSFCIIFFFFHLGIRLIRTNDRIFSEFWFQGSLLFQYIFLIFCLTHDHCRMQPFTWTMDGKIVDWRTCIDGENKVSYFLLACFLRILHHIWSINQSSFFSLFSILIFSIRRTKLNIALIIKARHLLFDSLRDCVFLFFIFLLLFLHHQCIITRSIRNEYD